MDMEQGKVRIVLLGHAAAASALLQKVIASDGLFTFCGECSEWTSCQELLDSAVPDVLIAKKGAVPPGWQVASTSLLWITESPVLEACSTRPTSDATAVPALLRELSQIYVHVLHEKARQLRSLLENYQASIASKSYVSELKARHDGNEVAVPVQHVEWIEGAGNWVRIHTPHGVYPLREMINEVLEKLPETQFVRIHRSTVVNRSRIAEITMQNDLPIALIMQSGVSLSVGVTFREPLRENSLRPSRQALAS
jgi:hypothetical protein